jgi:hypothetical protein
MYMYYSLGATSLALKEDVDWANVTVRLAEPDSKRQM